MADRLIPFGKYFLIERINVGGMAEVYKAKTVGVEGFEKIVAIKRILPSVAEDEEFIRMFVDEAKITSQLSHANLAQTFDLGKIDDTYYIAMEYVPGKDLRAVFERIKRHGQRLPWQLSAWVMSRVCEGLDYAHRKRDTSGRELHIVHRDVSPQNIIVSFEGEVKLIDFGIAKAANKITRTQAGILKGKFGYMSPEQVRGLPLDGRSDIFAAGVVLYELCTGERLFTGSSDFSVLEKVQQARVTPPSQVEPSIPLGLERIILKALTREPADRYAKASEMAGDLTRFLLEAQARAVTRDDLSAFMKATFPEDERREVDAPLRRPAPRGERAEIIVKSKLKPLASPDLVEPGDDATTTPLERPRPGRSPAPRSASRRAPPPLPMSLLEGVEDTPVPRSPDDTDPLPPEESTSSRLTRRARWVRRIQFAIVSVALLVAAWALWSTPRSTIARSEQKAPEIPLQAAGSSIVVLSSPPGAQVYLDGERKGLTPAFFATLDPAVAHAISVEKKCYRAWQVALPPHAGPRQLAATLQPAPFACPGSHLETSGMPAPADLPAEAAATATLGFLNLGARPSAQVLIDGVDIGQTTPLLAWPLHNGPHRLRLVGKAGSKELTVEIRTGETSNTIVDLSKPPPEKKAVKPAKRRARR